MQVLVTGGSGFLGSLLARHLLAEGVGVAGATRTPVTRLVLVDLVAPRAELASDERVVVLTGELDALLPEVGPVDLVVHLAGVVSGAAEADFDLGLRTNLDGGRALVDWARRLPAPPVVVFASSLAVFGLDPAGTPDGLGLGLVEDDTLPTPQSSYGVQKLMVELLLADASRKGYLRGRTVRLMTVAVRPGAPNAAASSFISGIIREPVSGRRSVCPVPPDTPLALSSPRRTLEGLVRAAEATDASWGSRTAVTLPALTTTPREMLAALDAVVGEGTSALVDWVEDPAVVAVVGSWPSRFAATRARALGLTAPADVEEVVREHVETAAAAGH